jgi:radical SAM superfamily enzyme YgiQ (UPF0313 family)
VEVLDLAGQKDYESQLRDHLASCPHNLVGVTATTPQFPMAVRILRVAKEVDAATRVAIGGPHPTVQPQSAVKAGFDLVVLDDGMGALDALLAGDGPKVAKGSLTDMDTWPLPARDLIDLDSYHARLRTPEGELRCTSALFSFGCPYRCTFCSGRDLTFYRKLRVRSPQHILHEMDHLRDRYDIRAFWVFDDEVNIRKDWLQTLCQAMAGKGYYWRAFIKANLFDEEVAKMMAEGGCVETCTGVESGSARILKYSIQKETTPEINADWVRLSHQYGMRTTAFCMVGNPGETLEDIHATRDWLIRNRPDNFSLTVFTPYPGSPTYDMKYPESARMEFQMKLHPLGRDIEFPEVDFSEEVAFFKGVPGQYKSVVRTSALSQEDLVYWRDRIEQEVREALGIPLYQAGIAMDMPPWQRSIDNSMGQGLSYQRSN